MYGLSNFTFLSISCRVLSAKTSSLHTTIQQGLNALTFASSLHDAGTLVANSVPCLSLEGP